MDGATDPGSGSLLAKHKDTLTKMRGISNGKWTLTRAGTIDRNLLETIY
jgi:hypothetical protein